MNILMLANNTGESDARIMRAAKAARSFGHNVLVYGRIKTDFLAYENCEEIPILRFSASLPKLLKPRLATKVARSLLGTAGWIMFLNGRAFRAMGKTAAPHIVHAHDIYTLWAGWQIAKATGAKLIYDAHELETGRSGVVRLQDRLRIKAYEKFLINRADAVITVSDSIADALVELYGIKRPVVINNAPYVSEPQLSNGPEDRDNIRSRLGLHDNARLAVYIGAVTFNRGLEQVVRAMPSMPDVHVAMVGPRTHALTESRIRALAHVNGVVDRLHLIDPVPNDRVTSFVKTADVSLVLVQDACLSYRFSFPNKLLESLFAGLPVVVSNLPEYTRMIEKTGAGVVVNQAKPAAIAEGVLRILSDRERYVPSSETISDLIRTYGWGAQAGKLISLYERVVQADMRDTVRQMPIGVTQEAE